MPSTQSTLQGTGIAPALTVNDLDKSIRFYEGLGFSIEDRYEENGKLLGAMLRAGQASLGLSKDDGAKGRDRVKGVGISLWIHTDQDLEELAAKAKAAGVPLDGPPSKAPWGAPMIAATNPDGFKVRVTQDV